MSEELSPVDQLISWIIDVGVQGYGVLPSAKEVAADHLADDGSVEKAIDSIIAWRTAYAGGTGFLTGLGGLATLPLTIPAGMATSYAIAANTVASIAVLRGFDPQSDQVRTMILLALVGSAGQKVLREAGVQIGTKVTQNVIRQIPGKVLIEINKKIGFRLITKAGEKGVVNLMKFVPVLGGVVGAAFDGAFVNGCGQTAKEVFAEQTCFSTID